MCFLEAPNLRMREIFPMFQVRLFQCFFFFWGGDFVVTEKLRGNDANDLI